MIPKEKQAIDYIQLNDSPLNDSYSLLEFKDGRIVERYTRLLDGEGNVKGRVWFFRDLTEKIKAETALRESEQKNKAILNAIPDRMYILDSEGTYLDCKVKNPEGLAVPLENVIGSKVQNLLPEEVSAQILELTGQVLKTWNTQIFEYELILEEDLRVFEVRMTPSGNDQVLMIERDITERKRSEQELVQRNYELDSFVYRASHDLTAPLNSLMGLIELVKDKTNNQEVLAYISMMDRSVLKLDTFIRNLADFSRVSRLHLAQKPINFQDTLDEVIGGLEFMKNFESVEKVVDIKEKATYYSDPFTLGIILSNLVSNAIKYLDPQKEDSYVKIEVEVDPDSTTIRVSDNGMGIPREHQSRIFDLFFRASHQSFGSGLGLYITRNAVHKMKGEISLHSDPGRGTTFVLVLPNPGPEVEENEMIPGAPAR